MSLRSVLLLSLTALFLGTSGCATRYQDLLRDRDAEIRDLESKLANSRADSATGLPFCVSSWVAGFICRSPCSISGSTVMPCSAP